MTRKQVLKIKETTGKWHEYSSRVHKESITDETRKKMSESAKVRSLITGKDRAAKMRLAKMNKKIRNK